jgi:hypothetical protein
MSGSCSMDAYICMLAFQQFSRPFLTYGIEPVPLRSTLVLWGSMLYSLPVVATDRRQVLLQPHGPPIAALLVDDPRLPRRFRESSRRGCWSCVCYLAFNSYFDSSRELEGSGAGSVGPMPGGGQYDAGGRAQFLARECGTMRC